MEYAICLESLIILIKTMKLCCIDYCMACSAANAIPNDELILYTAV